MGSAASKHLRLLLVEDNPKDGLLLIRLLRKGGFRITHRFVQTKEEMSAALQSEQWDIILSDYTPHCFGGPEALHLLQSFELDLPFIAVSGPVEEEIVVEMMRAGAHDYIMMDNLARLVPAVERELSHAAERRKHRVAEEALAKSEKSFRLLAENALDLIYRYRLIEPRGFEYVSPSSLAITGYTPEEHYADPDLGFKLVHPDDRWILQKASEGETAPAEPVVIRWVRKDGSIVWTEQRNRFIRDEAGALIAIEGIARDITWRIQSEETLRRNADRLEQAEAGALLGSWEYDLRSGNEWWSPQMFQLFNADPSGEIPSIEELLFRIHPDDRELVRNGIEDISAGRAVKTGEYRSNPELGPLRWFTATQGLEIGSDGEPARYFGTVLDITAQKAAEEALRQNESRYRLLFDINPQPMWVYDRKTLAFLSVNDSAIQKYGYSREEFLAMTIRDIRPPEDIELLERDISQTGDGYNYSDTWRHRLKNGEIIFVEIVSNSIDFAGVPARLVIAHDITARFNVEQALRESETRLRLSLLAANLGLYDFNVQTGEVRVNEQYTQMLGYDHASFNETFDSWVERLHPDDRQRTVKNYEDYLAGKLPVYQSEFRQRTSDGGWVWILSLGRITEYDADGKPLRMLGTHTDITKIKKSEELLLLHTAAIKSAANGIVITDQLGDIIWVNNAFTRMTGYTLEEVKGRNPRILKSGVHPREFYEKLWTTILSGDVWTSEMVNKRKDGSLYTDEITITPVRNTVGEITHFVTIRQDISERKESLRELSRQAYILDQAGDAIILRGLDHKILYWNKGAHRLYGWTSEEALGKDARELLYGGEADSDAIFNSLFQKGDLSAEVRKYTKDLRELIVNARFSLIHDADGKPESILSIATDITEKKSIERQFLRTQRLESLGTLASGIAHDLNNILAPIILSVGILTQRFKDDGSSKLLETIERSANRGSDIVRQILSFARGAEAERSAIQSRHLLPDLLDIFKGTFPRSIRFDVQLPKGLPPILADPTQFQQIIMNLCVNARDAMPSGGTITIAAESLFIDEQYARMDLKVRPGQFVKFTISDTGHGIHPDILDNIFDPFFTTKEVGKGTGLGLSSVHTIVKNHEGFMEVKSTVGVGTIFSFYIPVAQVPGAPVESEQQETPLEGNGEFILVVDDEHSICEITRQTLESNNYHVLTASNGVAALALYLDHRNDIALVITDLMMPVMGGAQLVAAIRQVNPNAKIVISSGLVEKEDLTRPEFAGCAILHKPHSSRDLLLAVKKLLRT